MLRWRFSTGLLLGLVLGLPAGALLALLFRSPTEPNAELQFQLRQLSRELEREKEARARADRQLEQFAEFANRMTASFQELQRRFEEMAAQATSTGQPLPTLEGNPGRTEGAEPQPPAPEPEE